MFVVWLFRVVGLLVGWLVSQLVGWLVGWLVGSSVSWLVGLFDWFGVSLKMIRDGPMVEFFYSSPFRFFLFFL